MDSNQIVYKQLNFLLCVVNFLWYVQGIKDCVYDTMLRYDTSVKIYPFDNFDKCN